MRRFTTHVRQWQIANMTSKPPVGFRRRNGRGPSRAPERSLAIAPCGLDGRDAAKVQMQCVSGRLAPLTLSYCSRDRTKRLPTTKVRVSLLHSRKNRLEAGFVRSLARMFPSPGKRALGAVPHPHVGRPRPFLNGQCVHACFIPLLRRTPREGQSGRFRKPVARIGMATSCCAAGDSMQNRGRAPVNLRRRHRFRQRRGSARSEWGYPWKMV
jgi:hypothetical protein